MTPGDMQRIADLLLEVGGDTAWVLLWDDGPEWGGPAIMANAVSAGRVPAMVCFHLLRMLRGELGPEDAVVWEH